MRRCYTNAPDAYDYSYVVPVERVYNFPEGAVWTPGGRFVDIPSESYDYQTGRYGSGMYYAVEVLN